MRSMSRTYLMPGMTFKRGPKTYTVKSIEVMKSMVCELDPGNFFTLPLAQFESEYLAGHISELRTEGRPTKLLETDGRVMSARWEMATEEQRTRAMTRFKFIKELESEGPLVFDRAGVLQDQLQRAAVRLQEQGFKDVEAKRADEREGRVVKRTLQVPKRSAFYEWVCRYRTHGRTVESLLSRKSASGAARASRLGPAVNDIVDEALDLVLQGMRRTAQEWTSWINGKIDAHNSCNPPGEKIGHINMSTWTRRARRLPLFARTRARRGKDWTEKTLGSADKVEDPDYVLQVVQTDHSRLRIAVYDESTKKFHSEVFLTVMLCRRSRVILGFSLHIARHDAEVVSRCFGMMALPKTDFKDWCPDAVNDWPCYGIPALVICDNGMEFLSESFDEFCAQMGTDLGFAPACTPEWKGSVERWFRTIKNNLIKRLRGAALAPNDPSKPRRPEKLGNALTLSELDAVIGRWIVDVYHVKKHRALGMSPIAAWTRDAPNAYRALAPSLDDLLARTGKIHTRQLTREGIAFDNDQYKSDALAELFWALGPDHDPVKVVISGRTAYTIFVVDPVEGKYIKAHNVNALCRPGYTRERWAQIKRVAGANQLDVGTMVGANTAAAIVEDTNAKLATRRKATHAEVARKARSDGTDFGVRGSAKAARERFAPEPEEHVEHDEAQLHMSVEPDFKRVVEAQIEGASRSRPPRPRPTAKPLTPHAISVPDFESFNPDEIWK